MDDGSKGLVPAIDSTYTSNGVSNSVDETNHVVRLLRERINTGLANRAQEVADTYTKVKPGTRTPQDGAKSEWNLWYQCPKCYILLQDTVEFLDHTINHDSRREGEELGQTLMEVPVVAIEILNPFCLLTRLSESLLLNNTKSSVCPICTKVFKKRWNLSVHVRRHLNERRYSCCKCEYTACRKELLDLHIVKMHSSQNTSTTLPSIDGAVKNWQKCQPIEVCGTVIENAKLPIHMLKDTRKRPFRCENCGESFFDKRDLNRHKVCHEGDTPFTCTTCSARFNKLRRFNIHMRKHKYNIGNMFRCSVCEKGFGTSCNLKRHMMIHSDIRPFPCDFCEYRCRSKSHIRKHMVRHHSKVISQNELTFVKVQELSKS